jgi:hypothetical protein
MNKGSFIWYIPDGYYNSKSIDEVKSHEAVCVLNPAKTDANIEITLYFENRDKLEGFKAVCKAERTNHIRMDIIVNIDGQTVPTDVPYAMLVKSDVEVIVQYSRLDSSQKAMALMTTIAYPGS